jgi:O-antigen/teichoic acid export membrane protein
MFDMKKHNINDKSQLKVGVSLSYINIILSSLINILYTPIMLRLLGQSEFGVYSLCSSVVSNLGLFNFGFNSAYIRYYSKYKHDNNTNKIKQLNGMFLLVFLCIAIIVLITGSVLVINIKAVFGDKLYSSEIDLARVLMAFLIANMAVYMLSSIFTAFITSHEKYVFQRGIEIFKTLINPFLTLPLLLIGYNSLSIVQVIFFITVLSFIINIWYCLKIINMEFEFKNFDFKLLVDISKFSFFILIQMVMDQLNWQISKFIVGRYVGSIAVAIYAVGSQFNNYFIQFSGVISSVFTPRIHNLLLEDSGNTVVNQLFVKVARIQFIIVYFLFSSFVIFGQSFLYLWAGPGYEDSYIIAILLILPIIIPLTENLGIEILRAKNLHGAINMIYLGVCIINIIISIPLCKRYGAVGSALGTFITMFFAQVILQNIYYHFVAKIDIKQYIIGLLKFIPALIIPTIYGLYVSAYVDTTRIITLLGMAVIYAVVYSISLWLIGMNSYEKSLIKRPINKLLKINR